MFRPTGTRTTLTGPNSDRSSCLLRDWPMSVTSQPARAAANAVFWTRESPVIEFATMTASLGLAVDCELIESFQVSPGVAPCGAHDRSSVSGSASASPGALNSVLHHQAHAGFPERRES